MLSGWLEQWWCSGQVLACGAKGPGFDSQSHHYDFKACFQVTNWLKYIHHQSDVNPQNNKPSWNIIDKYKDTKIPISRDFCILVECDYFQRGTYAIASIFFKVSTTVQTLNLINFEIWIHLYNKNNNYSHFFLCLHKILQSHFELIQLGIIAYIFCKTMKCLYQCIKIWIHTCTYNIFQFHFSMCVQDMTILPKISH